MHLSAAMIALIFVSMVLFAVICGFVTGILCKAGGASLAAAVLRGCLAVGGALLVVCALVGALTALA